MKRRRIRLPAASGEPDFFFREREARTAAITQAVLALFHDADAIGRRLPDTIVDTAALVISVSVPLTSIRIVYRSFDFKCLAFDPVLSYRNRIYYSIAWMDKLM